MFCEVMDRNCAVDASKMLVCLGKNACLFGQAVMMREPATLLARTDKRRQPDIATVEYRAFGSGNHDEACRWHSCERSLNMHQLIVFARNDFCLFRQCGRHSGGEQGQAKAVHRPDVGARTSKNRCACGHAVAAARN
jgi:hypothetical protein